MFFNRVAKCFGKYLHFDTNKKKSCNKARLFLNVSGWQDSNLRPPRPKRGAMTGLRYTPKLTTANVPLIYSYNKHLFVFFLILTLLKI